MSAGTIHDPRPEPPREPLAEECCNGGCDPCVYDRYLDALERYHEALRRWRQRHPDAAGSAPAGGAGK